jgi:ADP-heptose:LPS heptosyltransferase
VRPQIGQHEALGNFQILSAWRIAPPDCPALEIHADPALARTAEKLLPEPAILCHLAASAPKKEWPLAHWVEFYRQATAAGYPVVFSTGVRPREQALLADLKRQLPNAPALATPPDLALFLAVVKRARLFISGDTGPMHLAVGLGIPTVALFGPSSPSRWAPLGGKHQVLQGSHCTCDPTTVVCQRENSCMAAIPPESVFRSIPQALGPSAGASV